MWCTPVVFKVILFFAKVFKVILSISGDPEIKWSLGKTRSSSSYLQEKKKAAATRKLI
jgi:hypothetical protein